MKMTSKMRREQELAAAEFWCSKADALWIALKNGWAFSWPTEPPESWKRTANRLLQLAGQAAKYEVAA